MATEVGLGRFIFYAYTMPLLNAHPTVKGTLQRLEGAENGPIGFGDRINPELADRVLSTAHALLLSMLFVQVERFPVEGLETMVGAGRDGLRRNLEAKSGRFSNLSEHDSEPFT